MLQSQPVGQISVMGGEPIGSKSSCDDTGSVWGKDGVWKTGVDPHLSSLNYFQHVFYTLWGK